MEEKTTHWNIRISKGKVKYALIIVFILTLLTLITLPMYCDYTDRAKVTEIISTLSSEKLLVESAFLAVQESNNSSISVVPGIELGQINELTNDDGDPVILEYIDIDSGGTIRTTTSGLPIYIQFTPKINDGEVSWQCFGKPSKIMPGICR